MNEEWTPTQHGGYRRSSRTRVAQQVKSRTEEVGERSARSGRSGRGQQRGQRQPRRALPSPPRTDAEEVGGSNPSPRTKHFYWHEKLGLPGCEYLHRWRVETRWGSIRLHHWIGPDDDRHRHDHPWNFTTLVLWGGYTDLSPNGDEHLQAPALRHRSATHKHTVIPDPGGCWTIIFTGPKLRNWGFWVNGKFKKANKYFLTFGHHPCD